MLNRLRRLLAIGAVCLFSFAGMKAKKPRKKQPATEQPAGAEKARPPEKPVLVVQSNSPGLPLSVTSDLKYAVAVGGSRAALWEMASIEIERPPATVKPSLHQIAFGVSKYRDAQYNLTYAAKDARDLTALLGE